MSIIKSILMFFYTELFLEGLEVFGLILDHTKDGKNLRLNKGKGIIPRSPIAMSLVTGIVPVFFQPSPQLRDTDGEPVQSGGDRTWMQVLSLQLALRQAGMGKTHAQMKARLAKVSESYGVCLPAMGERAYAAELEEAAKHPGEYKYVIFPGNALGGGKGVPVGYIGYIKDFARLWSCDGVQARKLVLSFCKWGQPGSTHSTGNTIVDEYPKFVKGKKYSPKHDHPLPDDAVRTQRNLEIAIVAEDLMEIDTWDLHTKKHDGLFFFNGDKIVFQGRKYLDQLSDQAYAQYASVMIRYRVPNPIDVWKGLAVFLKGDDFRALAKDCGVKDSVDMITSAGNIKQGDTAKYRSVDPSHIDFLNLTKQYSGGMSIGRQLLKGGIMQKAAYDLFTFCRKGSFRYIPFLESMIPIKVDPLDVYIQALKGDYEAVMNILLSVDMISYKDCVSLVKRNLFCKRVPGQRPQILRYKTNYNSIAPKLTSFFANYVIKAHGHFPLAYIVDDPQLDALRKQIWNDEKRRVNPYIPHKAKRKLINFFLKREDVSEWRFCGLKQPVVGAASIQPVDLVVKTETGYRMWDQKTDKPSDICYSNYGDRLCCVALQQMPADCDGDQFAFQMYPAREGNEFSRCPVFDEMGKITGKKKGGLPESEDSFMDTYIGVILKMRSTIGIVDNIMTKFGCRHILANTQMTVKQSMLMALAFEYWVIKEQMRPGGKGESQEDAIEKLVDTFMGGVEPKTSHIFKFGKDDQGVGYASGHAKVVNWTILNARNVCEKELPRIHKGGGVYMYQDIAMRIAKEFPKTNPHDELSGQWTQCDADSLLMKAQFQVAEAMVTQASAKVTISKATLAQADESASRINDLYASKSSSIMRDSREGKITKAEKTELFNKLMGDELAPYLEKEIVEYAGEPQLVESIDQLTGDPVTWEQTDYDYYKKYRRFERALCIRMGITGFQAAGTNGGFFAHVSPNTVAFVAGLIWDEHPIVKKLEEYVDKADAYHELADAGLANAGNEDEEVPQ